MKWLLIFLATLSLATACVVEDQPVNGGSGGTSGTAGTGATGGTIDPCGGCTGDTPVCDEENLTCVQCLTNDNCDAMSPVCDEENNVCVCNTDADCNTPELARCNTAEQTCEPCQADSQCDGIEGLPATDNVCDDGTCVDCTPETEADTCDGMVSCNALTNTCTDTRIGSLFVCDECVADSECGDGSEPSNDYRCIPMFYPDGIRFPDKNAGFCLKTTESGCERPYAVTLQDRTSLSEPASANNYCGINESLATCPAVAALVADDRCPGGSDEEFPPGGICRQVGALQDRCTYLCSGETQCDEPPNPGAPCGPGSSAEDYCGG
jgi:hypothetical protein